MALKIEVGLEKKYAVLSAERETLYCFAGLSLNFTSASYPFSTRAYLSGVKKTSHEREQRMTKLSEVAYSVVFPSMSVLVL